MTAGQRLWDKGAALDAVVHRFTVGDDPQLDQALVPWDCLGSAAHARTLARAGWLADEECAALLRGLAEITRQHAAGAFVIPDELEDCHTAIEAHLIEQCGDAGRKIHTGRSRNDQVATAMRLWLRATALQWAAALRALIDCGLTRIAADGALPLPGYTHLQPAMPSSVGQWLHAQLEAALDQLFAIRDLLGRLDACPLGSGAGFGAPLKLDRAFTANLLGFARAQRSPIDVQNSRGRVELLFVRVGADIGAMLEKLASDLVLYNMAELGYVTLPEAMTTGSSIMPQKRNPDVLELLRGRGARLRALETELQWIAGKLPSSYHRDLQLTKRPTLAAGGEVLALLDVATRVLDGLTWNADRLRAAMRPELYATHAAVALAERGTPFRDAYRQVGQAVREGRFTVSADDPALFAAGRVDDAAIAALRGDLAEVSTALGILESRYAESGAALLPEHGQAAARTQPAR